MNLKSYFIFVYYIGSPCNFIYFVEIRSEFFGWKTLITTTFSSAAKDWFLLWSVIFCSRRGIIIVTYLISLFIYLFIYLFTYLFIYLFILIIIKLRNKQKLTYYINLAKGKILLRIAIAIVFQFPSVWKTTYEKLLGFSPN